MSSEAIHWFYDGVVIWRSPFFQNLFTIYLIANPKPS